jgi:hypothetical protein
MSTPTKKPGRPKKDARRPKEVVFDLGNRVGGDFADFTKRAEDLTMRTLVENGAADFILARPNHPYFMRMLEYTTDRAFGKVPQEVKNQVSVMPAVALPAKEPEQIPDADYDLLSPEAAAKLQSGAAATVSLLLPPKADGSPDHLEAPAGAADDVPHRE